MTIERKPLFRMNQDAINYLAQNTNITFLNDGGIATSLVKAPIKEIATLQDYATTSFRNTRLSTASGIFLDMIGELLNVVRLPALPGRVDKADGVIRFYVNSGSLGAYLPHPTDRLKGRIPINTRITDISGSIVYAVTEDIIFPRGSKSVFVSAESQQRGSNQAVGINKLVSHNLGVSQVFVTNDFVIGNARDSEDDDTYRFRISNAVLTLAGGNRTAMENATLSFPGVQSVQIREFVRGTGSFDVFIVPVSQRLSETTKEQILATLKRSKALGVDVRIREPKYIPIFIAIQMSFYSTVDEGRREAIRLAVKQNIKTYFESISLGGEVIINQLRSVVMSVSPSEIRDMRILELCFKGQPQIIRNIQLSAEELLILDETRNTPIEVI